jgi:hypothetical protein
LSSLDPDRGYERRTAALGRRDWNYFTTATGVDASEWKAGESPWASQRITIHDRFDRTLGIPERSVTMWPTHTPPDTPPAERAAAICRELLGEDRAGRSWPEPARCRALLEEVADSLYARPVPIQRERLAAAARRYDVDAATATDLAIGVGSLVARTTHHRGPALPGLASLNLLSQAQLGDAVPLFLARDGIRRSQALSDPDLPRMWILSNGLQHGVPASVMRQVPAQSVGPAAAIIETHDDLLGWDGMATAVRHMDATVRAAAEGRHWLETLSRLATADDRALAVGVISLTQPGLAARLARPGVAQVTVEQALWATRETPGGVLDLTDQALKSVCDRNGWLMGSPGERTQREMTQRAVVASGSQLRDDLSAGDSEALSRTAAAGPDDAELDRGVFRNHPPPPDVVATQQLLRATGAEALRRFAGFEAPPRASYAEALAHRFPAQLSRNRLEVADPAQLLLRSNLDELGAAPVGADPAVKRGSGRRPIGPRAATKLPAQLLAALDEQAALAGVTRPELMRRYLAEAITANMTELRGPALDTTVTATAAWIGGRSQPAAPCRAPALNAEGIIEALNRHQVRYVTIGDVAAQQQGAALPAAEIDITPAGGQSNLERLSAALDELGARVRPVEDRGGMALNHHAASLARSESWELVCRYGEVDLSFRPTGTGGYHDLIRDARMGRVGDQDLPVASLGDIIRMKAAAGQPQDIEALPTLNEALERQANLLQPPEPPSISGPELGPVC